jgi:hypothetical protein
MHHGLFTKNWSVHVCSIHAPQSIMSNCLITICTYEYWEIQSPPNWGGGGTKHKNPCKVPRNLLLINNKHLLPRLQYTWCNTMMQLLGCSTQWETKNIHHYVSEYTNFKTSVIVRICLIFPQVSLFSGPQKMWKKRYNNIRFIVLQSIILSH